MQQSEKGGENWDELLGIYSGFLQDQNCNDIPPECSQTSIVDPTRMGLMAPDFPPVAPYDRAPQIVPNVAFAETYNTVLPWDNNLSHLAGLNQRGNAIRGIDPVDEWGSFDRNAGSYVHLQNKGDVFPHQKVDSTAELMGIKSRIACDGLASVGPYSQIEREWNAYGTGGMMHLQNQILNGNQDYNLQQTPTSKQIGCCYNFE